MRHLLAGDQLVADGAVVGAAAHGEIVTDHHHRPALHPTPARDQVRGNEAVEPALVVVLTGTGELAELAEAARVEQPVDALAYRQPAVVAMALELFLAPHLLGEPMTMSEFLELLFPGQGTVSRYD